MHIQLYLTSPACLSLSLQPPLALRCGGGATPHAARPRHSYHDALLFVGVKYDFIGYVENMGSDREHMVKLLASRDSLMHKKEVVSKLLSVHLDHASYKPMHIPHELCQRFADVCRQDVRLLCG